VQGAVRKRKSKKVRTYVIAASWTYGLKELQQKNGRKVMANIQASHIGFKRGVGYISGEGILRKYELNYTPNDALIAELISRLSDLQPHHFFYRIRGQDLYILARSEEALEYIDEKLQELGTEIVQALKIQRLQGMVE
jgi:hypothetical protein